MRVVDRKQGISKFWLSFHNPLYIIYGTLCGKIKDKNSTLYAIKCQVCCIENTAR